MQASEKLPTYEESAKSPKEILMDRLKKKIEKAQKPEDLLTHLLSTELNVEDKATLLRQAPKHIYDCNHRQSAEYVEAQLREAGYGELAIYLYWCFFWYRAQPTGPESWIKELIELDIEERWVAQRKACIQEKLQTLKSSSELPLSSEDGAKHASQLERDYGSQTTVFPVDSQHEDSHFKDRISTGISLLNYAKIARGEEVAVGGRADVAQYHERSMGFEQKGCVTEVTALQHALVVWMPTSLMA
ncbi:hypothetical protein N7519_001934 [Penicillium mononematosum]|uniref:uncharacterized protein n=1 Tax=Penicillium mononematosum TaxID=268346 RepID=UPI0025476DA7|nr:uncharacterized protein N7519_001934 [Penicillium mononematosum]KAJ6187026.1 hypothetical protein N7519_001934 [Penicillium mononematosum]